MTRIFKGWEKAYLRHVSNDLGREMLDFSVFGFVRDVL